MTESFKTRSWETRRIDRSLIQCGQVSLGIGELVGTYQASLDDMMQEMIVHERHGIQLYRRLLELVEGRSVSLEELARQMVRNEELHVSEIEKMLRKRGDA